MKKILFKIVPVLICVLCVFGNVYAAPYNTPVMPNATGNTITSVITTTNKFWASIVTIVQVLSVGCFVFAGVRYMFASAEQKADLKKGLVYLAIGAALVFSTATVIRFVYNFGKDIIT